MIKWLNGFMVGQVSHLLKILFRTIQPTITTIRLTMFDNTANDPELNGKYLGTISKDFVLVADVLKEASYAIRKRGFSDHPIFPVSKVDIPLGRLLVRKYEIVGTDWNYYVSYLDEFMQRQLVEDEAFFRENYKAPDEYCCLFVVDETFTNFVFIPYPED